MSVEILSIYFDFLGKLNCRSGGDSGFLMRDWPKISKIHISFQHCQGGNWSRTTNKDDDDWNQRLANGLDLSLDINDPARDTVGGIMVSHLL